MACLDPTGELLGLFDNGVWRDDRARAVFGVVHLNGHCGSVVCQKFSDTFPVYMTSCVSIVDPKNGNWSDGCKVSDDTSIC